MKRSDMLEFNEKLNKQRPLFTLSEFDSREFQHMLGVAKAKSCQDEIVIEKENKIYCSLRTFILSPSVAAALVVIMLVMGLLYYSISSPPSPNTVTAKTGEIVRKVDKNTRVPVNVSTDSKQTVAPFVN